MLLFFLVYKIARGLNLRQAPVESSDHSTNRPGSTCSTVFIRSRNVFALFSSPTGTVSVKRFVEPLRKGLAVAMVDEAMVGLATVVELALPDRISMMSTCRPFIFGLLTNPFVADAGTGSAAIWGI